MATCKDLMSSMVNINEQDTKWKQSLSCKKLKIIQQNTKTELSKKNTDDREREERERERERLRGKSS